MATASYNIQPLGDAALLVQCGNVVDEKLNRLIISIFHQLKKLHHFAIKDVVPGYSSVAVHYDVAALYRPGATETAFTIMRKVIEEVLATQYSVQPAATRVIKVPVCYENDFAPDIEELAEQKNITLEEVIQLHTSKTYRVYMLGFLPGFPYMGEVDETIAAERKQKPREHVTAGSVGIAGKQTGIYPLSSPGGWQIIGRTPLKIFDAEKEPPVLFAPGDEVEFYSITKDEFKNFKSRNI